MRILPGRTFPPDQGAFFYRFRIEQHPLAPANNHGIAPPPTPTLHGLENSPEKSKGVAAVNELLFRLGLGKLGEFFQHLVAVIGQHFTS